MTTPQRKLYEHERILNAKREAAEELYEALEALVRSYGTCGLLEECPTCNRAIAILAKARGEQS